MSGESAATARYVRPNAASQEILLTVSVVAEVETDVDKVVVREDVAVEV